MSQLVADRKEPRRIHPHKFAMWVAMGSIAMMFAGLTSAYIVRKAQGDWRFFNVPTVFWISTVCILFSSLTIWLAVRAFKERAIGRYRSLLLVTLVLGLAFGVCQAVGFTELYSNPQPVVTLGPNGEKGFDMLESGTRTDTVRVDGNVSESFLFIITGLHILHVLGGIVALLIAYLRSFRKRVKVYNSTGIEVVAQYWHFVDVLWIYLFLFFLANQ
jgi:cytochrome c oxidase subunit 3